MPGPAESDSTPRFLRSPLLVIAACFALGIFLVHPEHRPVAEIIPRVSVLLASAGTCLLAGLFLLRFGWLKIASLLALMGFVIAGATASHLFEARFPPDHVRNLASSGIDLEEPVRLEGVINSTPLRTPYGLQFDIEARSIEFGGPENAAEAGAQVRHLTGKVQVRLETSEDPSAWADIEAMHLQYGDSIRALLRLRRPTIYRNPGGFDYRRWMESIEDVYWTGTVNNPLLLEKLAPASGLDFTRFLEKARRHFIDAIDRLYPPWSSEMRDGAVLKAVLLGERASLDSETIENFRKTGLYHLLVIAGLHIGLLALIANFLFRLLPLSETWRSVLVLIFLAAYASLVEQRAPTLRATLLILLYLIGRLLYRERALLNAIGLAALVLLLYRPAWLRESGFELSFAAVLSIAGLAVPILARTTEPYRRALRRIGELGLDQSLAPREAQFRLDVRAIIEALKSRLSFMKRHPAIAASAVTGPMRVVVWTANLLLFSAILQLGLLLPTAEVFHRVSLAGIALNALAIPVMVLVLALGVPTVLLGALSPALAAWPAKVLAVILSWLFGLTNLPWLPQLLSFRVAEPPLWVAWGFVFSAVIAGLILGSGRRPRLVSIPLLGLLVFAAFISFHPFAPRLPRGALEVTALDCGGGDAVFLVLPDQTTLLMDAGSTRAQNNREGPFQGRRWNPGEDIVSPYLWSRGVEKIDVVALTRTDEDLAGVAAVIRNFRVRELWHATERFTPAYQDLLEQARRQRITIREMAEGDRVTRGETSVSALWPPRETHTELFRHQAMNDLSLVLRVSSGEASVLLPGDISGKVELELLRSGSPLESGVLKVARHGAKTSSTLDFIRRVSPRVALLSVDGGGRTDLPSTEVLERLRASGAEVYRTDLNGAVTVEMEGRSISVRTYATSDE